jgi:hypothetical protein
VAGLSEIDVDFVEKKLIIFETSLFIVILNRQLGWSMPTL